MTESWLQQLNWNKDGLLPAIAQDVETGRVLMQAWINPEALISARQEGRAVYWSRSNKRLWRKGEESGHVQKLHGIFLDCDGDSVIYQVEPIGGIACHTGRASCFYRKLEGDIWRDQDPVLKAPEDIYNK